MLNKYGITPPEWAVTPMSVQTAMAYLEYEISRLEAQIDFYQKQLAALQQQADQTDALKLEIAQLRERSDKTRKTVLACLHLTPPNQQRRHKTEPSEGARGAQPSHTGNGRKLKPSAEADQVVEVRPVNCSQCGQLLLGNDPQPMRLQVSDLTIIKAEVTEYRRPA